MTALAVLISGRGSNLQAILAAGFTPMVRVVVSNRPEAGGLAVAREHGIETAVVDHQAYPTREAFDSALATKLDEFRPDWVILAGFMRVLTPGFVERYHGRLVNIHPSLLPAFPGLHTHERALAAGVRIHGASVHFVTAQLDHGPIIVQAAVPVLEDDTPQRLAARVLRREHVIYPLAIRWLVQGKVELTPQGRVRTGATRDSEGSLIWPDA